MSFIFQKNGDYLVFYAKNQKRAFIWDVRQDELSLDSPPVYHRDDEQIWQKEHGTLSDFLYLMADVQAVFGLSYNNEEFIAIDSNAKAMIQSQFRKAWGICLLAWHRNVW